MSKKEKYWIKGGMKVRTRWGGPVMIVMRVLSVREGEKGSQKTRTTGVKCYWIDESGMKHVKRFHTRDLEKA